MKYLLPVTLLLGLLLCLLHDMRAQCLPDRHTTNLTDGWMSCTPSIPPTGGSDEVHWIAYDLGQATSIYDIHLWNISHPGYLHNGVRDIVLHGSTDGTSYMVIDTISVARADPSSLYSGAPLIDLQGQQVRHIVITALSTHGGTCAGFAEIRMHTADVMHDDLSFHLSPCENAGLLRNLTAGLQLGGTYAGPGVTDHGDETFDFDPDVVGPGRTTITYTYLSGGQTTTMTTEIEVLPCGDVRCPDCTLCDSDTTILYSANIPTGLYHREQLRSPGDIQTAQDVIFRGREEVTLLPGFEVNTSSELLAEIRTCEVNLLENPGYEAGFGSWGFWFDSDSVTATQSISTTTPYEGSQCVLVSVTEAHEDIWRVFLYQDDIQLDAGTYRLSFAARSDVADHMSVNVNLRVDPWTDYLYQYVQLKPHWQRYAFEFEVRDDAPGPSRIGFRMGSQEGDYFIDQVRISKK